MVRYDKVFSILAERAVGQAAIDIDAFMKLAVETGVSEQELVSRMIDDLENDGPVFGKFVRSMTGAASSSVVAATRQGEMVGEIDGNEELKRLARQVGIEGSVAEALESADPEEAEFVEQFLNEQEYMWVAELIKTCHRCLPLHGRIMRMAEWKGLGLLPETIHDGWVSSCHCRVVPADLAESKSAAIAPLRRIPSEKGLKRTQRAITEKDVKASQAARDDALKSEEGRRMLRRLGQAVEFAADSEPVYVGKVKL